MAILSNNPDIDAHYDHAIVVKRTTWASVSLTDEGYEVRATDDDADQDRAYCTTCGWLELDHEVSA